MDIEAKYPQLDTSDITSLLKLVVEQQRGLRDLIEDAINDIEGLKYKSEAIAVNKTILDNLMREFDAEKKARLECQSRSERNYSDVLQKREVINSKISEVENRLTKGIYDQSKECSVGLERLRSEIELKIDNKFSSANTSIKDIQNDLKGLSKSVAFDSGKYGGIVSIAISIVMFLMKAIWDHITKK